MSEDKKVKVLWIGDIPQVLSKCRIIEEENGRILAEVIGGPWSDNYRYQGDIYRQAFLEVNQTLTDVRKQALGHAGMHGSIVSEEHINAHNEYYGLPKLTF